jgi:hypothetical protein
MPFGLAENFSPMNSLPRWLVMWLIAGAIYFGCKLLTWRAAKWSNESATLVLGYLFLWPGMNATRFLDTAGPTPNPPAIREWLAGTTNFIAGAAVFWLAKYWIAPSNQIWLGWAGMIGTILMLHFGSFQLLSCAWRSGGVDAQPLMNQPIRSTSVTEFWGRRWHTAFRDLTYQFIFRPLTRRMNPVLALCVGFFISGLIHELVITVPAGGGYGGPTAFFCIQAAAILFERSDWGKSVGLGHAWPGWLFTAVALLLPVQLLFPNAFVTRIAVPFMAALGGA